MGIFIKFKTILACAFVISMSGSGQSETIKVINITNSTPEFAKIANEYQAGLTLAWESIEKNKALSQGIEIFEFDSQSNSQMSASKIKKLIRKKNIDLIVGGYDDSVCREISEMARQTKTFYFITGCQKTSLTSALGHPYVARTSSNNLLRMKVLAEYVASQTNKNNWSRIKLVKSPFDEAWQIFWQHLSSLDTKAKFLSEKILKPQSTNMVPHIQSLLKEKVSIVFDESLAKHRERLLTQGSTLRLFEQIDYVSPHNDLEGTKTQSPFNGYSIGFPWYDNEIQKAHPNLIEWVERFEYRFGRQPTLYAAWGYQSAYSILAAIVRASGAFSPEISRIVSRGYDITYPSGRKLPFGQASMRGCDQQVLSKYWIGTTKAGENERVKLSKISISSSKLVAETCRVVLQNRANHPAN